MPVPRIESMHSVAGSFGGKAKLDGRLLIGASSTFYNKWGESIVDGPDLQRVLAITATDDDYTVVRPKPATERYFVGRGADPWTHYTPAFDWAKNRETTKRLTPLLDPATRNRVVYTFHRGTQTHFITASPGRPDLIVLVSDPAWNALGRYRVNMDVPVHLWPEHVEADDLGVAVLSPPPDDYDDSTAYDEEYSQLGDLPGEFFEEDDTSPPPTDEIEWDLWVGGYQDPEEIWRDIREEVGEPFDADPTGLQFHYRGDSPAEVVHFIEVVDPLSTTVRVGYFTPPDEPPLYGSADPQLTVTPYIATHSWAWADLLDVETLPEWDSYGHWVAENGTLDEDTIQPMILPEPWSMRITWDTTVRPYPAIPEDRWRWTRSFRVLWVPNHDPNIWRIYKNLDFAVHVDAEYGAHVTGFHSYNVDLDLLPPDEQEALKVSGTWTPIPGTTTYLSPSSDDPMPVAPKHSVSIDNQWYVRFEKAGWRIFYRPDDITNERYDSPEFLHGTHRSWMEVNYIPYPVNPDRVFKYDKIQHRPNVNHDNAAVVGPVVLHNGHMKLLVLRPVLKIDLDTAMQVAESPEWIAASWGVLDETLWIYPEYVEYRADAIRLDMPPLFHKLYPALDVKRAKLVYDVHAPRATFEDFQNPGYLAAAVSFVARNPITKRGRIKHTAVVATSLAALYEVEEQSDFIPDLGNPQQTTGVLQLTDGGETDVIVGAEPTEAVGTPKVSTTVTIQVGGVASTSEVGDIAVSTGSVVNVAGIESGVAGGVDVLLPGVPVILPGIHGGSVGRPTITEKSDRVVKVRSARQRPAPGTPAFIASPVIWKGETWTNGLDETGTSTVAFYDGTSWSDRAKVWDGTKWVSVPGTRE